MKVSILLILAMALACGPSRNGKVTGLKNNKPGNEGTTIPGQKMLQGFEGKINELKKHGDKVSKPSADLGFVSLATELYRSYELLANVDQNNQKQANMNRTLESLFGNMIFAFPDATTKKDKVIVAVESFNKEFLFKGEVDKNTGRGILKAEKVPNMTETNATNNITEINDLEAQNARPQAKTAVPKPVKPTAVADRFSAQVTCLDSGCELMIVKFIQQNVGFFPLFVRTQMVPNNGQNLNTSLVSMFVDQVKSIFISKQIPVTENPGSPIAWTAQMTEANFMVESVTKVALITKRLSTSFTLRNASGGLTEIDIKNENMDLSNPPLHDVVISLIPKR